MGAKRGEEARAHSMTGQDRTRRTTHDHGSRQGKSGRKGMKTQHTGNLDITYFKNKIIINKKTKKEEKTRKMNEGKSRDSLHTIRQRLLPACASPLARGRGYTNCPLERQV